MKNKHLQIYLLIFNLYFGLSKLICQFVKWMVGVMLVSRKVKTKRNRAIGLLFFPLFVMIGFIGWCMYAMDGKGKPKQKTTNPKLKAEKENVTLMPIVFEEQKEQECIMN